MTNSNPARSAPQACAAPAQATADVPHGNRLGLTRGQRLLAAATAAAILVSGINGLVQVMRVLVECWLTRP